MTVEDILSERVSNPQNRIVNFMREALAAMCQGEFNIEAILNKRVSEIVPTIIEQFVTT
jgi:hypothetical protein